MMLAPILDPAAAAAIGIGARPPGHKGLNIRHGTILTLEDISVSFDGSRRSTQDLYIGVGELRCIIGPNGAARPP